MWYFGKIKNTEEWVFDCFTTLFEEDEYIEVTDEVHDEIIEQANAQQKWISGDKDGNPILIDPPPPSEEAVAHRRIKELEGFLQSTDWYAIRFADTGEEIPVDIKKQRQDARDEISRLKEE